MLPEFVNMFFFWGLSHQNINLFFVISSSFTFLFAEAYVIEGFCFKLFKFFIYYSSKSNVAVILFLYLPKIPEKKINNTTSVYFYWEYIMLIYFEQIEFTKIVQEIQWGL